MKSLYRTWLAGPCFFVSCSFLCGTPQAFTPSLSYYYFEGGQKVHGIEGMAAVLVPMKCPETILEGLPYTENYDSQVASSFQGKQVFGG